MYIVTCLFHPRPRPVVAAVTPVGERRVRRVWLLTAMLAPAATKHSPASGSLPVWDSMRVNRFIARFSCRPFHSSFHCSRPSFRPRLFLRRRSSRPSRYAYCLFCSFHDRQRAYDASIGDARACCAYATIRVFMTLCCSLILLYCLMIHARDITPRAMSPRVFIRYFTRLRR